MAVVSQFLYDCGERRKTASFWESLLGVDIDRQGAGTLFHTHCKNLSFILLIRVAKRILGLSHQWQRVGSKVVFNYYSPLGNT